MHCRASCKRQSALDVNLRRIEMYIYFTVVFGGSILLYSNAHWLNQGDEAANIYESDLLFHIRWCLAECWPQKSVDGTSLSISISVKSHAQTTLNCLDCPFFNCNDHMQE